MPGAEWCGGVGFTSANELVCDRWECVERDSEGGKGRGEGGEASKHNERVKEMEGEGGRAGRQARGGTSILRVSFRYTSMNLFVRARFCR